MSKNMLRVTGAKGNPAQIVQASANKAGRGYIRMESEGWSPTGEMVTLVGFLRGATDKLEERVARLNWVDGTMVQGGISVEESHEAFYEGQTAKTKGEGGDIVLKNGKPVFRTTVVKMGAEADSYVWHEAVKKEALVEAAAAEVNPVL